MFWKSTAQKAIKARQELLGLIERQLRAQGPKQDIRIGDAEVKCIARLAYLEGGTAELVRDVPDEPADVKYWYLRTIVQYSDGPRGLYSRAFASSALVAHIDRLGVALYQEGDIEGALAAFDEAADIARMGAHLGQEAAMREQQARCLWNHNVGDGAREHFRAALKVLDEVLSDSTRPQYQLDEARQRRPAVVSMLEQLG